MAAVSMKMGTQEAAVTAEDQRKINKFARFHLKYEEVKADLKKKNNELSNFNDGADELLLLCDDNSGEISLKIGDSFVFFDSYRIEEKLQELKSALQNDIEALTAVESEWSAQMAQLKVFLYNKFGNNINLETDDD